MGVLEARKDAEKVGFPVVGEEKKDTSNIIDYDIHEEITIGTSSVFNANNDTTTGMATVIPGVNAPKLLEKTSIYANSEGLMGGITASGSVYLHYPDDNRGYIRSWNLSDKYGNINFRNRVGDTVWEGLIIPTSGWYDISMVCPPGSSVHSIDVDLRITRGGAGNDITLINHIGGYNSSQPTETLRYNFTAGDTLYAYLVLNYIGGGQMGATPTVTFTVTKL